MNFREEERMNSIAVMLSILLCFSSSSFFLSLSQTHPADAKKTALYQEKKYPSFPEHLLDRLSEKSEEYERYALKFVCTEILRKASYNLAKKEYKKEDFEHMDYLLEINPEKGRFSAFRQKARKTTPGRAVNIEMNFPEAYSWVFIFSKNFRNSMKYGYHGKEIYFYKLAHIISFRGFQPFTDGKDIRQWEGRLWVEEGTWNILKVEAKPIHQDDILELKRLEYNRAFSFMGLKFKKKPLGYSCTVYFDFEHEGLSFPTEARNEMFQPVSEKENAPHSKIILSYADYLFFKTESREEVLKFRQD